MTLRLQIALVVAGLCVGMYCASMPAIAAVPPIGTSARILKPDLFPTWQAWNVMYPFVIQDTSAGGYRMYYTGTGETQNNDSLSDQWMTGSASATQTAASGSDWDPWIKPVNYEPILIPRKLYEGDVIDPDDMATQFDSMFAFGVCVIRESASSYKMWYTGWNGEVEDVVGQIGRVNRINFRIGYATSTNGVVWIKQPGPASDKSILGLGGSTGQLDAKGVGQPFVRKEGPNDYRMWYEGFDGTYWRIFYATSTNGTTWTKRATPVVDRGGAGALDELGARNPVIDYRNGQYEMWYQGQSAVGPHYYHVLRATSSDGITWNNRTEVVLHPDDSVDGTEMIHVDSSIVNTSNNSVQLFYAKQNTEAAGRTYGTVYLKRYIIYTEVLP